MKIRGRVAIVEALPPNLRNTFGGRSLRGCSAEYGGSIKKRKIKKVHG